MEYLYLSIRATGHAYRFETDNVARWVLKHFVIGRVSRYVSKYEIKRFEIMCRYTRSNSME